jgi:hypothetical protein
LPIGDQLSMWTSSMKKVKRRVTIIRKRERFSHELTLAYESGQITELKETKEAKPCDEERS